MRPRLGPVLVGLLGLVSCGERSPGAGRIGAFGVALEPSGLRIDHDRAGVVLEPRPLPGSAAGAGFAHRTTTSEMNFGYHYFAESSEPWQEGVELVAAEERAPGTLRVELAARAGDATRLGFAFRCAEGERFLGFGAQVKLDERGRRVPIWTSEQGISKADGEDHSGVTWVGEINDSYFPLPILYSTRGYALVVLGSERVVFDLCREDPTAARVEVFGSRAELVVVVGTPLELVERVTAVTGRPRRPPPWAFGHWVDAVGGADAVRRTARLLRERQIPASALWSEDWAGGANDSTGFRLAYRWEVDRTLYPDLEALAAELHDGGFRWLAYFNTFVQESAPPFAEAVERGYLLRKPDASPWLFPSPRFENAGLVDLESAEARRFLGGFLDRAIGLGFDGWMADYGEWVPYDARTAAGTRACHNCYPDLWAALNREVFEAARPDGDWAFFVRSGHLGTVAQAPVVWAGDQNTDWDRLDGIGSVVPLGLGLGLGGVAAFTHDIGGYSHVESDPTTKELFFRWTELGAFSPVMRNHHGSKALENWRWDKDEDSILHFKRYAETHVRLYPFWEGLARVASETGVPIIRMGWLHHPEDPAVAFAEDQYLLGDALLVAPVVTEAALARDVALPAGRHYDFWTGAAVEGGGTRAVAAPLGDIPVFARAGAIVPLLPAPVATIAPGGRGVSTLDPALPELEVRVYLGAPGRFVLGDGTVITLDSKPGDAAPAGLVMQTGGTFDVELGGARVRVAGSASRTYRFVGVGE